jgi:uncharacterized protein with PQ loop repeat
VFFDVETRTRPPRSANTIAWERKLTRIVIGALIITEICLLTPYMAIGARSGFGSLALSRFGQLSGIVSSAISFVQYLPQFITVWKLKDNGSLSIVTLAIQAPGGTLSSLSMIIGQRENWSTWISLAVSALQQWLLLALCLWYKLRARCVSQDAFASVDSWRQSAVGTDANRVDARGLLDGEEQNRDD